MLILLINLLLRQKLTWNKHVGFLLSRLLITKDTSLFGHCFRDIYIFFWKINMGPLNWPKQVMIMNFRELIKQKKFMKFTNQRIEFHEADWILQIGPSAKPYRLIRTKTLTACKSTHIIKCSFFFWYRHLWRSSFSKQMAQTKLCNLDRLGL
jgi:hypothetical protein